SNALTQSINVYRGKQSRIQWEQVAKAAAISSILNLAASSGGNRDTSTNSFDNGSMANAMGLTNSTNSFDNGSMARALNVNPSANQAGSTVVANSFLQNLASTTLNAAISRRALRGQGLGDPDALMQSVVYGTLGSSLSGLFYGGLGRSQPNQLDLVNPESDPSPNPWIRVMRSDDQQDDLIINRTDGSITGEYQASGGLTGRAVNAGPAGLGLNPGRSNL
ncbi:hypothetical protein, partial [Parvibium lacunae]